MSDHFLSKETKFPNLPKVPVGGASAVAPRWEANRVIRVIATGESPMLGRGRRNGSVFVAPLVAGPLARRRLATTSLTWRRTIELFV